MSTNRTGRKAGSQRPAGRAGRPAGGRARTRPLPSGDHLYTPSASQGRQSVERRSAAPLAFLHQLPPMVPAVVLAVLLVAGLAVHGWAGAAALAVLAAALGWLAFVSWPRLGPAGRAGRVLAVCLLLALAAWQATR
ncbi:MAG TPA: DUF6703 family protein [Streptosporangiaceae bacterium]